MNTTIYIRAASCISPQPTFMADGLPAEMKTFTSGKLNAIEPDYKIHLNIPAARRMSRLIKLSVCAALSCLKDADIKNPGAIICGTGLGCMEDSEKFLASLLDNNEQTLSPTSFIFSTHNTVAAQVALLLQCYNYNFTHTHRGLSFENALLDAILFLNDHPDSNVLAGATDEVTPTSFKILQRLGAARQDDADIHGTNAGEGAVFFSLQSVAEENTLAKITDINTFSIPVSENVIFEKINNFIVKHKISKDDFILTGLNGDAVSDKIYHEVIQKYFSVNNTGTYKHLCGEYHTSTASACWLSALMLKSQRVPGYVGDPAAVLTSGRILIFNHYKGREFSLLLLEKC